METQYITVAMLKEFLRDIPEHYTIILSNDGEGNSFSPLAREISFGTYQPDNPFIGDVEFNEESPSSMILFPIS